MKQFTIYIHRNKINNKAYIGQTCQKPEDRWSRGYKGCSHFQSAIDKYGWDSFEHIIFETGLTQDEANKIEEMLIALFDTTNPSIGYNIRTGGKNTALAEETNEKMKGKRAGVKNGRARKVKQYSKDGEYIKTWDYINQAAEELNIAHANISKCCRGKLKTCGGFIWKYEE